MGKVYLVGAGCGALELYTIKAMACIKKADCLIYDALIDSRILNHCKESCEKIYVGKVASHHAMKQEEICELLVKKSYEYETVVRLKGGDVYVFGRGGEEGELLSRNHVDFEVVPGLSSVTAGLAYAGIPITHRGISGGFQVYTGSLKANVEREFDFSLMLDDYCTYVFLMSMSKLEKIVQGFLNAGKKPQTKVAVISKASLPNQKTLVSDLEKIVDDFNKNPLDNPGIIVVGNVVNMRQYLNFYENKPLFSKKLLVTSVGKDHFLSHELEDLGGYVKEVVCGEIEYLDADISDVKDHLIFTSVHGVRGFMQTYLKQRKDIRGLSQVNIICIGEKTNQELNKYYLNADYMPLKADSDDLNREFKDQLKGDIYLVKGENKTNINIHHHEIVVYRNKEAVIDDNKEQYDYGFFTCASSVRRFYKNNSSLINTFVSIGKHTTKAIKECYGDVRIIETSIASKEAMIKAVMEDLYV